MRRGQFARVGVNLHGVQGLIEVPALAHGVCLLPCSSVRIKRVTEVLMAAICIWVGPYGRAQQRKPQYISFYVIAIFGVVDEAEAVLAVAEISPALCRDFKLGVFDGIVACGWP